MGITWKDAENTADTFIKMFYGREMRENKRGKWIDVNGDGSLFRCNQCGDTVCCKGNNFCPNCGACMR